MTDLTNIAGELVDDVNELTVDIQPRQKDKPWQRWIDAELGLRNHWYPIIRSKDLRDGESKAIKALGEDIYLTRQKGEVRAIEDRCRHRGVKFSDRPLHYTDETVTCWYHTWTYNLDDGQLCTVLSDGTCSHIGRIGIKVYPAREAQGLVFVFIGDIEPPDLRLDLPPGFLDENTASYVAEPFIVDANWRLGCENGFDPSHHFIHNWSPWTVDSGTPMPFGWVSSREALKDVLVYEDADDGPKGFTRYIAQTTTSHEANIPRKDGGFTTVQTTAAWGKTAEEVEEMRETGDVRGDIIVGCWLPAGLVVAPFPKKRIIHFEFYVPQDEKSHHYIQVGQLREVTDPAERERWEKTDGYFHWEVPAVQGFTIDDKFAREGLQRFYGEEDGWHNERLFQPDVEITMWRKFASTHARGIQTRANARGEFPRTKLSGDDR